jgi:selenocysteine-specific elongation factor
VRRSYLTALGIPTDCIPDVQRVGDWLVTVGQWERWRAAVGPAVTRWVEQFPLDRGMPLAALRRALDLPDAVLVPPLISAAGLTVLDGRAAPTRPRASLGPAEGPVTELERRLQQQPFAAPDHDELVRLRLGRRELAAAEKAGRLLRIGGDIVLLPSAPTIAAQRLRALPAVFTTSQARQALDTTRRVALPLLEYLDAHGITERVDPSTRRLR